MTYKATDSNVQVSAYSFYLEPTQLCMWLSLVPRSHFSNPPEKWVWSTAYSIFVQVCRNAGALFFFFLFNGWRHRKLHSTSCANDLLAKCTLIGQP